MHPFETLKVPENSIGIHWFGQNSFALKDSNGLVILIDPHFPRTRSAEFIHSLPPLDESDLKTDLVLLTHEHGDHTWPESLQHIHLAHPHAHYYGPTESMERLKELSIPQELQHPVTAGDSDLVGTIAIHAVFSKPPLGAPEEGIPAPDVEHLGYVIDFQSVRVYVSGDPLRTISRHAELLQPIILLRPTIGLLTTHPTEEEFPDFKGSVELANKLCLKTAVPAHYGCFVSRTFDPYLWAACFPANGTQPVVIPYNESIIVS